MNMKFFDMEMPQFGIGTARCLADLPRAINGFSYAIERGIKVFETAERFGDWQAEEIIGKSFDFGSKSNDLFFIGKCHPRNATQSIKSCEESLRKLNIDKFDLYLLHYDDDGIDYSRLHDDFEELRNRGLINHYGIGSIEIDKLSAINSANGANFSANQVWYNPVSRNAENGDIQKHRDLNVSLMSYSVFIKVFENKDFMDYCRSSELDPGALVLRWVQRHGSVLPILSSYTKEYIDHLMHDDIRIEEHLDRIDEFFPNSNQKDLQTN